MVDSDAGDVDRGADVPTTRSNHLCERRDQAVATANRNTGHTVAEHVLMNGAHLAERDLVATHTHRELNEAFEEVVDAGIRRVCPEPISERLRVSPRRR